MVDPALAVVGIALAFLGHYAVGFAYGRIRTWLADGDPGEYGMVAADLIKWVAAGAVVGYVLLVEGRSLSSIGVRAMAPVPFAAWVLGGFVATYAVTVICYLGGQRAGLQPPVEFVEEQAERPLAAMLFTAVTAGVTESVLFQGYPIERLASLLGSLPLAGAVSFVVFTAVHYVGSDTYSVEETFYIAVPALGVTVLYVLTGNLFVVIVVHSLSNSVSMLAERFGGDVPEDDGAVAAPE